ncbi:MAG TPA: thioredoxin family protein [Nitratifractor sp.]|nr:thioredoxin family protein [Nitratifractor sp.]
MKRVIIALLFAVSFVYGATAFNLDGIKKYDILILNKAKELKPLKKEIEEMMLETSKELGIKIVKLSSSTFLLKIRPIALGKAQGYLVELNVAEFLKREGLGKEVFALSYQDNKIVKKESDTEMLVDSIQAMLDKFSSEYLHDNNKKGRAEHIDHHNFATKMGYREDFSKALEDAKSQKKYIMVVADAPSCPWCRKLEENILSVASIDKVVQSKFIPAVVNVDAPGEPMFLKKKKATPIIYIVDPRDKSIKATFEGYPNAKNFIDSTVNKAKK